MQTRGTAINFVNSQGYDVFSAGVSLDDHIGQTLALFIADMSRQMVLRKDDEGDRV